MAYKNQTVTNVLQPHETENSSVLRCLPKVPLLKDRYCGDLRASRSTKWSLAEHAVAAWYNNLSYQYD